MQCLQKDKKGDESATGDGWTSDDKKAILITEPVSDKNSYEWPGNGKNQKREFRISD
jgi:hypothetical protein